MNSTARKTILTAAILTGTFALVLASRSLLGPDASGSLESIGFIVLAVAGFVCAIVWSRGPADIDDDR